MFSLDGQTYTFSPLLLLSVLSSSSSLSAVFIGGQTRCGWFRRRRGHLRPSLRPLCGDPLNTGRCCPSKLDLQHRQVCGRLIKSCSHCPSSIVQELCESRGGRPGLSVLTSLLVCVDVKIYSTVLRHWSQLVPKMSADI